MIAARTGVLCVALAFLLGSAPALADRPEPLPLRASALLKHLDQALADDNDRKVERVVRALVVLNHKARGVLKRELKRVTPRLPHVLEALRRMEPSLRLMAKPLLTHTDPAIRASAAATLDGADAPALITALKAEKDPAVQYALIDSIAASEEKSVGQFLSGELVSADPQRRIQALKGLQLRGERDALSDVYAALRDPNPAVRRAGIDAVAVLGDGHSVKVLLDLVTIEGEPTNQAAIWLALRWMTGQDFGDDAEAWRRWLEAAG